VKAASAVVTLALLAGCCHHHVVAVGSPEPVRLDRFLADHPVPAADPLLAVKVGETASASYHVIQVRTAERPHVHQDHDALVTLLRGKGELHLGDRVLSLRCGDTVSIPRGTPHWFVNGSRHPAVAFATFSPPYDGKDMVPVEPAAH
jgi:quercetin dioxygenase-like cupin family protein